MMRMHAIWPRDHEKVKDVRIDKAAARRVWQFAAPYRAMVGGFLVAVMFQAILGLVPAVLFGSIIDKAIPTNNRKLLGFFALAIVVAALLQGIVGLVERFLSSRVGEGVIYDLRVALFGHVQSLPLGFFTRTQTGVLTNRLNNDVIGAQRALTATLGTVVSNVITLLITLVTMMLFEWRLTVVALLLTPFFILPYRWIGGIQQKITRDAMDLNAAMNATMTERFGVAGALLVKLFGRGNDEVALFSDRAGKVRDIGIRSALLTRGFLTMLTLLGALGTAMVYGLGGLFAIEDSFSVGQLATMGLLVGRIYAPLTSLTNARVDVLTALVSFDRVFEVLDAKSPIQDKEDAIVLSNESDAGAEGQKLSGALVFDDVCFEYPNKHIIASLETDESLPDDASNTVILDGVNFSVKSGEFIALVGPSGSGKSTLASLIPRLYDVTSGSISVAGFDIRDVTQQSLRGAIGVVSQDPHLFHESIGDNLRYADPEASEEDLRRVCRDAQILDVIDRLPAGFDTIVGERGYRMSGGEKQRISIARMLLKDPAIVILDEATSHLDAENEALVHEALGAALQGRTALVIAHRLSTITGADQILVLDEGQIVERGTHRSLIASEGLYHDLFQRLSA